MLSMVMPVILKLGSGIPQQQGNDINNTSKKRDYLECDFSEDEGVHDADAEAETEAEPEELTQKETPDSDSSDYEDEFNSITEDNKLNISTDPLLGGNKSISYSKPANGFFEFCIPDIKSLNILNLDTDKSKLEGTDLDIFNITFFDVSDNLSIGCIPLFMCTPKGVNWAAEMTGDKTLVDRATNILSGVNLATFDIILNTVRNKNWPAPVPKDLLLICATIFKRDLTSLTFISAEDVDTAVANEINPPPSGSKENFYADKVMIHCIICLALICVRDQSIAVEAELMNYDITDLFFHINSAYYYFYQFAVLGNSLLGVKASALLIMCFSLLYHTPALMVSSIAVRLAQDRGLHLKQTFEGLEPLEAERQRRLWWAIYSLEKIVTMRCGKPSVIAEDIISTPLPSFHPEIDEGGEDDFCVIRSNVELYMIWAKVHKLLYTHSHSRKPTKQKLLELGQLDNELLKWAETLPPTARPGSDRSYYGSPSPTNKVWSLALFLQFCHCSYYFIMLTIHRHIVYHPSWIYQISSDNDKPLKYTPNGANWPFNSINSDTKTLLNCMSHGQTPKAWLEECNNIKLVPNKVAKKNERLLQSYQISTDCAREIIKCLSTSGRSPVQFISMKVFILNAFITLFVKCLMQPSEPECTSDLELMTTTIQIFSDLGFYMEQFIPQQKDFKMLSILKDAISKYVEGKKMQ